MILTFFFAELHWLLLKQYRLYPELLTNSLGQFDRLLFSLSKKYPQHSQGPNRYLNAYNIVSILNMWIKHTLVPVEKLTFALWALGILAIKKQFGSPGSQQINFHPLNDFFIKRLENGREIDLVYWVQAMSNFSEYDLIKNPIPINYFNAVLKKINPAKLNPKMINCFTHSLAKLFIKLLDIHDPNLLDYKKLEKIVEYTINKANQYEIANICQHLFQILNHWQNMKPSFEVLKQLLARLEACYPLNYQFDSSTCANDSKNIGKTVYFIGEIIKSKLLYKNMSKEIEKRIEQLCSVLRYIFDEFMARYEHDLVRNKKINNQFYVLVNAIISALRGSALMGISKPSKASQYLSGKIHQYLQTPLMESFEDHVVLVRKYALYVRVTLPRGEKLPEWLYSFLQSHKPAPPGKSTPHGQAITALQSLGCVIIPETLLDLDSPLDIFFEFKGKKGIYEINGYHHSGWHHQGEPKDLFKAWLAMFIMGLKIMYFEAKNLKNITTHLRQFSEAKDSEDPIPDSLQLYEFITTKLPKDEIHWVKQYDAKIPAGIADPAKCKIIEPDISPWEDDEWGQGLEVDFKQIKAPKIKKKLTIQQLMQYAMNGQLAEIKNFFSKGDINPETAKPDPYIRVVTLMCAMEAAFSVTQSAKLNNIKAIIENLILNMSIEALITVKNDLSPLILAFKWQIEHPENPDIFSWINSKIMEKISKIKKSLQNKRKKSNPDLKKSLKDLETAWQNAAEIANKMTTIPHIEYKKLLNSQEEKIVQPKKLEECGIDSIFPHKIDTFYGRNNIPRYILRQKAEQDHARAQLELALGEFSECDQTRGAKNKKIVYWLLKSANAGYAPAQFVLGCAHFKNGQDAKDKDQIKTGLHYFQLASAQGCANSQLHLGMIYKDGVEVVKDLKQALIYLFPAAEQGLAMAQGVLGHLYEIGEGVEKNLQTAKRYFQLSAEQGLANAQGNLGKLCEESGEYDLALHYYKMAADQGDALGQFWTGRSYELGIITPKNLEEAKRYYSLSAAQGNEFSKQALAQFVKEEGVERLLDIKNFTDRKKIIENIDKIESQYADGINHSSKKAMSLVKNFIGCATEAEMYYKGAITLLELDNSNAYSPYSKLAILTLQRSVDLNYPNAIFKLGLLFETGRFFKKDIDLAKNYYRQAAELGFQEAIEKLKKLRVEFTRPTVVNNMRLFKSEKLPPAMEENPSAELKKVADADIDLELVELKKAFMAEVNLHKEDLGEASPETLTGSKPNLLRLHNLFMLSMSLGLYLHQIHYIERRAKKSIDELRGFFINQIKRVDEIKLKLEQSLIAIEAQQFTEKSQYEKGLFDLDKSILQNIVLGNQQEQNILSQRRIVLLGVAQKHRWGVKTGVDQTNCYNSSYLSSLLGPSAIAALRQQPPVLLCVQPGADLKIQQATINTMKLLINEMRSSGVNMICTVCQGWGTASACYFVVNMLIDNTLVIIDPYGITEFEAYQYIEAAGTAADIKEIVVATPFMGDNQAAAKGRGPLIAAIAEKLTLLGYPRVKAWLTQSSCKEAKTHLDKIYYFKDIQDLLKQSTASSQQPDNLADLLQDPKNYHKYLGNIAAEHKGRFCQSPLEEKVRNSAKYPLYISPVQTILQHCVYQFYLGKQDTMKIKLKEDESLKNHFDDLRAAMSYSPKLSLTAMLDSTKSSPLFASSSSLAESLTDGIQQSPGVT